MRLSKFHKHPVLITSTLALTLLVSERAHADSYREYDSGWAIEYAEHNYDRSYGQSPSQNPFTDFDVFENGELVGGGNCTNFVSQAIIADFIESQDAHAVYDSRYSFDIDRNSNDYKWYFHNIDDRGPAFTGAQKLWEYAKYNSSDYKGLHFEYVTHDTLYEFMDYQIVLEGDVVFADWNHDGTYDHSMLVTDIQGWHWGYNEIRLTYQGTDGIGKTNIGLGDVNEDYNYQAVFQVYRPVDYNPNGL